MSVISLVSAAAAAHDCDTCLQASTARRRASSRLAAQAMFEEFSLFVSSAAQRSWTEDCASVDLLSLDAAVFSLASASSTYSSQGTETVSPAVGMYLEHPGD